MPRPCSDHITLEMRESVDLFDEQPREVIVDVQLWPRDEDEPVSIGRLRAVRFDEEREDSQLEAADMLSAEAAECVSAVWDYDVDEVADRFTEAVDRTLWWLDHLELDEAHRGRGIGHTVIEGFLEHVAGGRGVAVMIAGHDSQPLQRKALQGYWGEIGFRPTTPGSKVYFRDLSVLEPAAAVAAG